MKIELSCFFLKTDRKVLENGSCLRGCIAARKPEILLMHNHLPTGGFKYDYPEIQYKIINGMPLVVAINEAIPHAKEALGGLETLRLGTSIYRVLSIENKRETFELRASRSLITYVFATPYVALNSKNSQVYKMHKEKKEWLYVKELHKSIIIGNILSLCKSFGVVVEAPLRVKCMLDEERIVYRGIKANAFSGSFGVNYQLPDFIGVGRGVSEGWGTIIRAGLRDRDEK